MLLNKYFAKNLLHWHSAVNDRILPWKNEKDPYKIWLSEILLQQTRAEAVIPFYLKITTAYPTIQQLAKAPQQQVFAMWQGLGYYSRCRNLLATAQLVTSKYNGVFPSNYLEIIALKGIGPYTASAIASFAFNLPYAVVDGNVYRIISRFFGIETPIDSTVGKKTFALLAQDLLAKNNPAAYNQAIMDFGATICAPAPKCNICALQKKCVAFATNTQSTLPIKEKKLIIKNRNMLQIIFVTDTHLYIKLRTSKDVWQDLHEFYNATDVLETNLLEQFQHHLLQTITIKQQLTHQLITTSFLIIPAAPFTSIIKKEALIKVAFNQLPKYAFPKMMIDFLHQSGYLPAN